MPDLDSHNSAAIDKAAAQFVELALRAVREAPHGSLTLVFEWRACAASRFVTREELSHALTIKSSD